MAISNKKVHLNYADDLLIVCTCKINADIMLIVYSLSGKFLILQNVCVIFLYKHKHIQYLLNIYFVIYVT